MATTPIKRSFFQRLFGISLTKLPKNPDCWAYADQKITIDLEKADELKAPGQGLRLEGEGLPTRVLVFLGTDKAYHAVCNKCTHGGRRLDPAPDGETVHCCSIGKSLYDKQGHLIEGSAKKDITAFEVQKEDGKLVVVID